jgi:hypothetical protein
MNKLMGSGPVAVGSGGNADGPPPGLQGALGATPQAAPTIGPNMLARPPAAPAGLPGAMPAAAAPGQLVPPSIEQMTEVLHKVSYINATLKQLLGEPDLSTRDILDKVGDAVADGIMGPFDAARELASLPPGNDSLALRQWVAGHYANSKRTMDTIIEMIEAHGQMVRRGGRPQTPQLGPPPAPRNAFMAPA